MSKRRIHQSAETFHFPYSSSSVCFKLDSVFTEKTAMVRKWSMENGGYGDGEPNIVRDLTDYRFTEKTDAFQTWFGYAPQCPIPEFRTSFPEKSYRNGEVEVILSDYGVEFRSLYRIPITVYNLLEKTV